MSNLTFARAAGSLAAIVGAGALALTSCGDASPSTVRATRAATAPTTTEAQTTSTPAVTADHVVDGDTFEGSDGTTYRLAAIDAPESGTEHGPAATRRLTELLTGRLTIELGEVAPIDRYGRTLAYVFAGETFVNETLVREGLATESFYGDNVMYRHRYLDAQAAAQAEGLGIWHVETPTTVPPPTTTAPPPPPPTTAPPAPAPTPPVAAPPVPAPSACTPGYDPCIPPASDVDCAGGSGNGPAFTGPVRVTGPDIYDLDRDGDGLGCE
jgi:endonuclease YncB( thermonuclease family)